MTSISQVKQRWKRRLVFGAVGAALLVGGTMFGGRYLEGRAVRRVSNAFARYERCMLGAPLEPGERPSARFRRISMAQKLRGEPGFAWRASCRAAADQVRIRIKSRWLRGLPALTSLYGPLEWVDGVRTEMLSSQERQLMDEQWQRIPRDIMTEPQEVTGPEAPLPLSASLDPNKASMGGHMSARPLQRFPRVTDPVGQQLARVLMRGPEHPRLCTFVLDGEDDSNCRDLPSEVLDSLNNQLIGQEAGAPEILHLDVLDRGSRVPALVLVEGDQAKVVERTLYDDPPGYVRQSGEVLVLRRISNAPSAKEFLVRRGRPGEPLMDLRLSAPTARDLQEGQTVEIDLVRDWVLWTVRDAAGPAMVPLFMQHIPPSPDAALLPVTVPSVPASGRALAACHDRATAVLWGELATATPTLVHYAEQWRAESIEVLGTPRMSCREGVATIVSIDPSGNDGAGRIRRTDCSATNCTTQDGAVGIELDGLDAERMVASAVGPEVLFAWIDEDKTSLVKKGRIDLLSSADASMLFENSEHQGIAAVAIDALPRASGTVLVVSSERESYAVRVTPGEAPAALPVGP